MNYVVGGWFTFICTMIVSGLKCGSISLVAAYGVLLVMSVFVLGLYLGKEKMSE